MADEAQAVRSGRLWWLLVLVAVPLVFVVTLVVLDRADSGADATVAARAAAEDYLTALEQGDGTAAAALTCDARSSPLAGAAVGHQVRSVDLVAPEQARVSADVATRAGATEAVVLTMQPRAGAWTVCG